MTSTIILCSITALVMLCVAHIAHSRGVAKGYQRGFSEGVIGERYSAFDPMAARIDEIENLVHKTRNMR